MKMPYQAVFRSDGGSIDPKLKTALQYIWEDIAKYVNSLDTTPFTSGTLFPDEKPTGLGTGDENTLFYSTDFNRFYRWTGTAWQGIGDGFDYIAGFRSAPTSAGWHLADGSTNVRHSLPDGTTALITVPNCNSNTFFQFDAAYSGPTATAANAPGISGTTGTDGAHAHSFTPSGTLGSTSVAHTHTYSTTSGGGSAHHHTFSFPGTTGSSGSHNHSGSTWDATLLTHHHAYSGATGDNSADHTHDGSGLTTASSADTFSVDPGESHDVSDATHTHDISGSTGGESVPHHHTYEGDTDDVIGTGTVSVTVASDGSHSHTIPDTADESSHTHSVSGTTDTSSSTSHTHTFSGAGGTTSSNGDHSHTAGSLAVDSTGKPKSMAFIPYLRL